MPFRDRKEAGQRLAAALEAYRGHDVVVLALPRGGVPVAAAVAAVLNAPLDLILVRKIGAPFQQELAMGAVADAAGQPCTVRNEEVIAMLGVDEQTFDALRAGQLDEIERRRIAYLGRRPRAEVTGHIAIVVDDGVATGATTRAALRAVRRQRPAKLVLATPVAPTDTLAELRSEADEVVCLEAHPDFGAIGLYYVDFRQLSDEDVTGILRRFPPTGPSPRPV